MNSMTGPERLEGVTGRHWHGLDDGRIQCDVGGRDHDGRCGDCGSAIPGLFAARPGRWGQQRMQI